MLFGKAITAKGNKFMLDPKAKKAEKKSEFFDISPIVYVEQKSSLDYNLHFKILSFIEKPGK